MAVVVDFQGFLKFVDCRIATKCSWQGRSSPFDPVLMFKITVPQTLYSLSDEATEYQIKGRLWFQRFPGLSLDGTMPSNSVWRFGERLVQAKRQAVA